LQTELSNDSIYGSFADAEMALPQFLSYDIGAGLGIQESVADDLANDFLRTAVVGFGSSLGAEQGLSSVGKEPGAELEIAWTAKAEFCGNLVDGFAAAFPGDEHGKFLGDFIVFSK